MRTRLLKCSPKDLADWLSSDSESVRVIDVRDTDFDVGGHIIGAVNIASNRFDEDEEVDQIIEILYEYDKLVFHCMYSQQRGPRCAQKFRMRLEQKTNISSLPDIFILEGGFKGFRYEYGSLCTQD